MPGMDARMRAPAAAAMLLSLVLAGCAGPRAGGPSEQVALSNVTRFSTGRPGDEMAFHTLTTELMNFSPSDIRAFRKWLQDKRGLDLAGLHAFGDDGGLQEVAAMLLEDGEPTLERA